jgi:Family of unknown function (DUF5719)
MDHQEAGAAMRSRGQGVLALALGLVVVGAGVAFTHLGPKAPAPAAAGRAPSGAWFCPHGGGKGWTGTIYLANPGTAAVSVRLTPLMSAGAGTPISVAVPAGADLVQRVPVSDRSSSTFVEYFGGWIAAGWRTQGGGGESGEGAEPCASAASQTWYAANNDTEQGQDAYLVIMNPFAAPAVFSVVLYTGDRAPIRNSAWTDLMLKPRESLALHLNDKIPGETAVTAAVLVTSGRVAAGSVGTSGSGGVQSALAWPATSSTAFLPVAGGAGQSQLAVTVPGGTGAGLSATLLSANPPAPVNELIGASQAPETARVYPVITTEPSMVELKTQGGAQVVAALRAAGPSRDGGATAGVTAAATSWVVTPTVVAEPFHAGIVLANPSDRAAAVVLHLLAPAGASPATDITVNVPASSVAGVPAAFLASAPQASVLVTSDGPPIVAMGESTSQGDADYALAMGVPVPAHLP